MDVAAFLRDYTAAFETFDADVVAGFFSYPVHVVGETGDHVSLTTDDAARFGTVLHHLVSTYRTLDVAAARRVASEAVDLSDRLALAVVTWDLLTATGERVYRFDACYTIAEVDGAPRITAVAHNELARLTEALSTRSPMVGHEP